MNGKRIFNTSRLILVPVYLSLLLCHPLTAGEVPEPADPAGEVSVLSETLNLHRDRYQLDITETFEKERIWIPYNPSTALSIVRFTEAVPEGEAAQDEDALIRNFFPSYTQKYALFIHTSFELPGKQQFRIIPSETISLPNTVFRLSLWVRSSQYSHRLAAIFNDAEGKEVKVALGRLDFNGWKRIQADLPAPLSREVNGRPGRIKPQLKALVIESSSAEKPGDVSVIIDSVLILGAKDKYILPAEPW